jgi:outer membrane protein OmpA-like peptidoglycan-associated protein
MISTNFPRFVLLSVSLLTGITLFSQNTKEAVILYNSQPVKAEITSDGNVNKIISEVPDFLKGFTLKVQDYGQFIAEKQDTKSETIVPSSQSYAIVGKEFKLVRFEPTFATLSDEAIVELDKIIAHLRQEPNEKAVLVTLSRLESALISKNRQNSIRTYLKIRGIDPERVLFESLLGEKDVDEVKVHFLK